MKEKNALNKPNIISVTLRFALLAALGYLGWRYFSKTGFGMLGTRDYIILALIAVPAAAITLPV